MNKLVLRTAIVFGAFFVLSGVALFLIQQSGIYERLAYTDCGVLTTENPDGTPTYDVDSSRRDPVCHFFVHTIPSVLFYISPWPVAYGFPAFMFCGDSYCSPGENLGVFAVGTVVMLIILGLYMALGAIVGGVISRILRR